MDRGDYQDWASLASGLGVGICDGHNSLVSSLLESETRYH